MQGILINRRRIWLTCAFSQVCLADLAAQWAHPRWDHQPWAPPPAPLLEFPLDYQVFQRQTQTAGTVRICGQLPTNEDCFVQARLTGNAPPGPLAGAWQKLLIDPQSRKFTGEIAAPAGGWYQLEVRVCQDEKIIRQQAVANVGVGEVFIVAGQSNAGNHGSERQRTLSGRVAAFDGKRWRLAYDPLRAASGSGGSFMPILGDALYAEFQVPVGFVPLASAGTSVCEWLPKDVKGSRPTVLGGEWPERPYDQWEPPGFLFGLLTNRLAGLGPRGCRAVLWHQGEADAREARSFNSNRPQISGADYARYMTNLVSASRQAAGWQVPWFTAQVSYHYEWEPADPELRAAQKALWDANLTLEGPDTDALRAAYRDGVHFNAKGLREHGLRWADKVAPWLAEQLQQER